MTKSSARERITDAMLDEMLDQENPVELFHGGELFAELRRTLVGVAQGMSFEPAAGLVKRLSRATVSGRLSVEKWRTTTHVGIGTTW